MKRYDLSPLYRSAIGVDRIVELLNEIRHLEAEAPSYPPYDIEKTDEDSYRVTVAVAGLGPEDISVEHRDGMLVVSGRPVAGDDAPACLYRGIPEPGFTRRFRLADSMTVAGAHLADGLLHVDLVREAPETPRSRTIAIAGGTGSRARRWTPRLVETDRVRA